jgi:hypothetical protein
MESTAKEYSERVQRIAEINELSTDSNPQPIRFFRKFAVLPLRCTPTIKL